MQSLFGESGHIIPDIGVKLFLPILHFLLKSEIPMLGLLIFGQLLLPELLESFFLTEIFEVYRFAVLDGLVILDYGFQHLSLAHPVASHAQW